MRFTTDRRLLAPDSDSSLSAANDSPSAAPTDPTTENNSAPENPTATNPPAKNDDSATNGNSGEAGILQKIRRASASVANLGGKMFAKAKGRPKKCRACDGQGCEECGWTGKLPSKNDRPISEAGDAGGDSESEPVAENPASTDLPGDRPPVVLDNPETGNRFRRAVASSVKSFFGILSAFVSGYADASGIDPDFTDKAISKAMPSDDDIAAFNDDLDAVLRKHNVAPKNSEEWALAINGLKMAAPFAVLILEFRRELRRQRKEKK